MPLIKVIRHGFEFWEAPRCTRPPLPELEEAPKPSTFGQKPRPSEYRTRKRIEAEQRLSVVPEIPSEIKSIQLSVMAAFGVKPEEFFGRDAGAKVAQARVASMALCREYSDRTVIEIGRAHNRDHTSVSYSVQRFIALRKVNPYFDALVGRLESALLQKAA